MSSKFKKSIKLFLTISTVVGDLMVKMHMHQTHELEAEVKILRQPKLYVKN
jgi:hypothetical protein